RLGDRIRRRFQILRGLLLLGRAGRKRGDREDRAEQRDDDCMPHSSNLGAVRSSSSLALRTASAGDSTPPKTAEESATNSAPVAATASTEAMSDPPCAMQGTLTI